jgi:8-oxo-dGTP diphosphatase
MQVLVLIRHAVAAEREDWRGDDALRPLTEAGVKQSKRIAKAVKTIIDALDRDVAVASLRSSPAARCVKTVEPLAEMLGVDLEIDKRLMEGCTIAAPPAREDGVHILCAHGDNIPWLLEDLRIDWKQQCKKGSIWALTRDGRGSVQSAAYQTIEKG